MRNRGLRRGGRCVAWDLHQYVEVGRLETVEEDNVRTTFDVRSEVFISTFKTLYRPSYSLLQWLPDSIISCEICVHE